MVTNHALLAIDAMDGRQVLPEHDVVVVDEAHELVDRVTGVATAELTSGQVGAAARRLGKLVDQAVADRLAEAGEGLALVLEDLPPGRWDALPQAAAGVLSALRDAAASCRQSLGGERREDPEGAAGRKIAQAALDDVADTAVRLLGAFDEPDPAKRRDVVWLAEHGPDGRPVQGAARRAAVGGRAAAGAAVRALDRGPDLGDAGAGRQLRRAGPAVGAAAVGDAAAGGADDPVPDPDAPKWSGLDVGSPFAHARSGILYVARRLPPPGRDGLPPSYLDEIAGLVRGGRRAHAGAVLLDARGQAGHRGAARAARHAAALPGRRRDDAAGQAVRRGPGDVAVRHPVAVAGRRRARPLAVAGDHRPDPVPAPGRPAGRRPAAGHGRPRRQRLPGRLGHPRRAAAGPGRRAGCCAAMDDRGVVAILDPRLATARYGGFLRASLPPFWPTDDRDKVHAALRRLRG